MTTNGIYWMSVLLQSVCNEVIACIYINNHKQLRECDNNSLSLLLIYQSGDLSIIINTWQI